MKSYIYKIALSGAVLMLSNLSAFAILPGEVAFHDEQNDTTSINNILIEAVKIQNSGERIIDIARHFLEKPYVGGTLEGETEQLRVNLDQFDCTTLVENVVALAYTAGEGRSSWRDFIYNLEKIRYRQGDMNGYPSRLHYISDWIIDNSHRGIITEYTSRIPGNDWAVKTIDFMSQNRSKYPALADSANFERIKMLEMGYRSHRFPYIKAAKLNNKAITATLKNGDIIAITTKTPGLDVSHMGILIKEDNIPYLLNASSKHGKVVIESVNLYEYLRRTGGTGIRIIRLKED